MNKINGLANCSKTPCNFLAFSAPLKYNYHPMYLDRFKIHPHHRRLQVLSLPVVLLVILYLFLSFAGLIHVYSFNELIDDGGCSIGALFCHGQSEASIGFLVNHSFNFQYLIFFHLLSFIPFILFEFCPKRGPPEI